MPQLAVVNARAEQHISSTSELLAADAALLDGLAAQQLVRCTVHCVLLPTKSQNKMCKDGAGRQAQRHGIVFRRKTRLHCAAGRQLSSKLQHLAGVLPTRHSVCQLSTSRRPIHRRQLLGCHTALQCSLLSQQPLALRLRVVQRWLSQHAPTAVCRKHVDEVLALLQPRRTCGEKLRTSSFWRDVSVVRHGDLLLLLEGSMVAALHAGTQHVAQQHTMRHRRLPARFDRGNRFFQNL